MKEIKLIFLLFFSVSAFGQNQQSDPMSVNQNVKEIIVIFKTHFDIGYTHRVKDLLQYYRTEMIDKALDIMDKNKDLPKEQQFAWTLPGWVMAKVLEDWPGQTPERRKRLEEAYNSGRFVSHAAPFTVESEIMFPEDFARFYELSSYVTRKYGSPLPRGAKMTDVPSQASVLATGLAQGGVKFMHMGCNWPSSDVKYPPLFWWEGPDGSRVLTLYSPIYGTTVGLTYPMEWGGNDVRNGKNLIPPSNWPYSVWPAIFVTPDNSGPPNPTDVKELFKEVAEKMPGVKVRVGKLEDFADAILATNLDLPVVKSEAPDTWIHGVMCDPIGMKIARNINPLMPALEALNTQLKNWNVPVTDITKDVSKAYENDLLYSEHTWGGAKNINEYGEAFKKLVPESYKDLEESWEDKTDYIRTTENIIKPLLTSNLTALAQNVNCEGKRLVVYNPLPWSRSEWVEVSKEQRFIFAKNVPPCGYKTFSEDDLVENTSIDTSSNTIENKYFKVKFDPDRGIISSVIDKRTGREWADASAEQGLGQYLNERFTFEQTEKYVTDYQQGRGLHAFGSKGEWLHPAMYKPGMISEKQIPYRAATSKNGSLKIIKEATRQIAIINMPADTANHFPASLLQVTLQNNMPFIDMELTIKDKAKDNWPEADWFCFPFKVNSPKFIVGRSLGMMDPAQDIMEGSNKDLYAVGTGVTITDKDGSGIAFCPLDHPLVSLDRPGIWKFTKDFVPKKPVIYLNLYNNQWNTNFRYWYSGTWSSKVRIWTFTKDDTIESRLVTPSLEARIPLLIAKAEGKAGNLLTKQAGISLSRKGIQITAFRRNSTDNPICASSIDDEKSTLLRLWEQGGISGELIVMLPSGAKYATAIPVNLRGEKTGEPIKITAGKLIFTLKAYSPASFILNAASLEKKSAFALSGARFIDALKNGKKIIIVTMGTSLTNGTWSWPDVMMNDWFNKEFPGQVICFNEGVGASSSNVGPGNNPALSGMGKLPTVIAHKPDVVFIEFATNDSYLPYEISPDESRKNLNLIIDRILAANPKTEIILQTMNTVMDKLDSGPHASDRPGLAQYFQGYRDIAKARNLLLVDHYLNWAKLMKEDPARFDQLVPDGIHPQLSGYKEILLPELKKTLAPTLTNNK